MGDEIRLTWGSQAGGNVERFFLKGSGFDDFYIMYLRIVWKLIWFSSNWREVQDSEYKI